MTDIQILTAGIAVVVPVSSLIVSYFMSSKLVDQIGRQIDLLAEGMHKHEKHVDQKLDIHIKQVDDKLTMHAKHFDETLAVHAKHFDDKIAAHARHFDEKLEAQAKYLDQRLEDHKKHIDQHVDGIRADLRDLTVRVGEIEKVKA